VLGTVAWTVIAHRAHGADAGTPAYQHALATGFDRAFLVAAGIAVFMLVVAAATIRVRRADLSGAPQELAFHRSNTRLLHPAAAPDNAEDPDCAAIYPTFS
jgi:hypothetical protein